MIYTLTLNPAIDYVVNVENFQSGKLNRVIREQKFAGGKGINVSRVLKRFHVDNKALGFLGGFTGDFIKNVLETEGIATDFVEVAGDTRINVKLKSTEETEINGQGPHITEEDLANLKNKLTQIQSGDTLILSGGIPQSVPSNLYEIFAKWGSENGVRIVVDTSGKTLLDVVQYRPFLVKPNQHELEELFAVKMNSVEDVIPYGKKLLELGAMNVIVSMGGAGAVLFTEENCYLANVPKGELINSVGAGDSLVAGFIGTYEKTGDIQLAFQTGVAAGSATAFSEDLCTEDKVRELLFLVSVVEV